MDALNVCPLAQLEDAKIRARNTADRLNKSAVRLVYTRACRALDPLEIQLDTAALEYCKVVPNETILRSQIGKAQGRFPPRDPDDG